MRGGLWLVLALALGGCALSVPHSDPAEGAANEDAATAAAEVVTDPGSNPWTQLPLHPSVVVPAAPAWQHQRLPGKRPTQFAFSRVQGRKTMAAQSRGAASMLRQRVQIAPEALERIRFSWRVPQLIEQADLARRETDDSPVRIVLAFDGDRSRFSLKNTLLSELTHALTGEPMPYATLMYVWCNTRQPETVVHNPRTDRIRKMVVESGARNLDQWLDYERDIRADFERAFGEAPGPLIGVAIMTDTDNTHSHTRAWYGPIALTAPVAPER